ncbi:hypothetical protein NEMIN01_2478 [Nematocida minor]|uniref:uncharacterized protein n=1 Tax=Nematocida minor TaxID=1912983 RepID=UPI00221ED9A3|nr:uncharacterized protein NEMIN01_2478 [Nematocida minor]KAI5193322.1 hypothetical protein NEMIN01_2478 [Nematocida minor]
MVGLDVMREEIEGADMLVMIDYYTREAGAYTLKNRATEEVKNKTGRFIMTHGAPETLVIDNAEELGSQEMEEFLMRKNIDHIRTSIEAHASNGRIERYIRALREGLAKQDRRRPLKERIKR